MKIQIICNNKNIKSNDYEITYSPFGAPQTFDSFDVNIIDLQDESVWRNEGSSAQELNCSNDFKSLHTLIESAKKSKCIILFPHNFIMRYHKLSLPNPRYEYSYLLKDRLNWLSDILDTLLPRNNHAIFKYNLVYELSKTKCGGGEFNSAFCFDAGANIAITKAEGSGKATTIKFTEKSILTTLILANKSLKDFLEAIGIKDDKRDYPDWLKELDRFDDVAQREKIEESNRKVDELKCVIAQSNAKLDKNLWYKSMLTENDKALVEVVFDVLQRMLGCDLSEFVDEFNEDFLIRLESVTFVGEIKGVTSNVKNEHISQLDVHYQTYCDKLIEEGKEERVKALLIINPQRNKPISERGEINERQIELAERNKSLIILTEDLLTIFEKFTAGELSGEKILNAFETRTGLLKSSEL